jgi:superfamily II DNA/RNA helicase
VLARSKTGSGKTLAFAVPIIEQLTHTTKGPGALVLVPTRELAQQVVDAVMPYAKALGLTVTSVVGGMSFNRQAAELQRGIDLLVATPGRLTDHTNQRTCDLSAIEVTAIDEADRMADMGFLPQVRAILDLTPADGQRLLFSATLDGEVATLVRRYLHDPVTRAVASATAQVSTMEHHLLVVDTSAKPRVVTEIAARDGRTILFVRTKHGVDRLRRDHRGRPARRQGAERPQSRDRGVQGRPGTGAGRHGRRCPRYPRRRRQPGRARRPACRPQGLPAPRRPYGAGRRVGHGRHHGDPARAP